MSAIRPSSSNSAGLASVMLSGETAAGAYPVQSVSAMAKIVENAEQHKEYLQTIDNFEKVYNRIFRIIWRSNRGFIYEIKKTNCIFF